MEILSIILTSTVVSAIVAGSVSIWTTQKNIRIKNITEERKEWRDKIRILTKEVNNLFYNNKFKDIKLIVSDFETRLNPYDKNKEDQKIIKILYDMIELNNQNTKIIKEFNIRISLLLKHDWERVKEEIKFTICNSKEIKRKEYTDIIKKEER